MLTVEELAKDVEATIRKAVTVHEHLAERLHDDEIVQRSLGDLEAALSAVDAQMRRMGLAELCGDCGLGPRGGCCFPGMAAEADVVVLVINLLLNCRVATRNTGESECALLGSRGCGLRCKPVFCLSYSCPTMLERYSDEAMTSLDIACARAIREQLSLEDRVRTLITGDRG